MSLPGVDLTYSVLSIPDFSKKTGMSNKDEFEDLKVVKLEFSERMAEFANYEGIPQESITIKSHEKNKKRTEQKEPKEKSSRLRNLLRSDCDGNYKLKYDYEKSMYWKTNAYMKIIDTDSSSFEIADSLMLYSAHLVKDSLSSLFKTEGEASVLPPSKFSIIQTLFNHL